ncbi:MAG: 1-acyl-sn-glycerol-3-phosphate acyltransferase [Flavobacteriales bacterium]
MLFWYLYFWIINGLRMWFKKVYYHFEEPIPDGVPVIFACTHPNSAVDFIFLPMITRKPCHVLVRGDVFENKSLNKFFRSIWMLPVYRIRDGYKSLNKNADSFNECYDLFDRSGRVLIFSEGISIQEKKLQPLKKGTARLALDYVARRSGKEVLIVPMANNYSKFRKFRATVMTNFGKPIKASSYLELLRSNENQAYVKLTSDIQDALDELLIQPKDYSDESASEVALDALRLNNNDVRKEWMIEDQEPFLREKALVEKMNKGVWTPDQRWLSKAKELEISEHTESMLHNGKSAWIQWGVMLVLAPFVALAQVFHFLPYRISTWIVKTKIKDVIFENTVMVLGTTVLYMIQFWILFALLGITFGWPGIVVAISGLSLSLVYIELIDEFLFAWNNRKNIKRRESYYCLFDSLPTS